MSLESPHAPRRALMHHYHFRKNKLIFLPLCNSRIEFEKKTKHQQHNHDDFDLCSTLRNIRNMRIWLSIMNDCLQDVIWTESLEQGIRNETCRRVCMKWNKLTGFISVVRRHTHWQRSVFTVRMSLHKMDEFHPHIYELNVGTNIHLLKWCLFDLIRETIYRLERIINRGERKKKERERMRMLNEGDLIRKMYPSFSLSDALNWWPSKWWL